MHNIAPLAVGLLLLAASLVTQAHDAHHASSQRSDVIGAPLDFTLPTLDGTRFVKASAIGGPLLVNFWGTDCAPCIEELPRLEAFAKAHPNWTVLLVSTDTPAKAREFVQQHDLHLTVLRPGANVEALMRKGGNPHAALPFTVALREGRICDLKLGDVGPDDLRRFNTACTSSAAKP